VFQAYWGGVYWNSAILCLNNRINGWVKTVFF